MTSETNQTIELVRTMTGAEAAALRQSFLEARGQAVSVDASSVDHIGAQCLQVLVAAARAWRDEQKPMTIDNPTAAFCEGISRLGITMNELTVDQNAGEAA
ncbi:STAS domain-containing protein [Parvularcula sp. LCG005]|uniref:STAS domain-containing protein n=1 Tax=Parvularcula sp. LCG005 TaxID=3078805 RepID=UPI0029438FBB|nr:STAS domain-containing protein [Parvularcula sp. LCG005]WOI52618.1 STAS domain-containing protein [Parvularcula sp. LCG005]